MQYLSPAMPGRRDTKLVLVALLLALASLGAAGAATGQVRPGLAHRLDETYEVDARAAAASHDPDSDGALIGAAVGALAGILVVCHGICLAGGEFGPFPLLYGVLIGGLPGLVVGALVDAADPFSGPRAAPGDTLAARDTLAVRDTLAAEGERLRPCSRRNDAIGAAVGAGILVVLLRDFGGKATLAGAAIGAAVGAGIGSSIPEASDRAGCASRGKPRGATSSAHHFGP